MRARVWSLNFNILRTSRSLVRRKDEKAVSRGADSQQTKRKKEQPLLAPPSSLPVTLSYYADATSPWPAATPLLLKERGLTILAPPSPVLGDRQAEGRTIAAPTLAVGKGVGAAPLSLRRRGAGGEVSPTKARLRKGVSVKFPCGDDQGIAFHFNGIDGQTIASQRGTVASFEIEAIAVSAAEDLAALDRGALQRRVLVRAQTADRVVAALVIEQGTLNAAVSERHGLADIGAQVGDCSDRIADFTHGFQPPSWLILRPTGARPSSRRCSFGLCRTVRRNRSAISSLLAPERSGVRRSTSPSAIRQGRNWPSAVRRRRLQWTHISLVIWLMNPTVPRAPARRKERAGPLVRTSAGSSGPSAASMRARISAVETKARRIWPASSCPCGPSSSPAR